MIYILVFYQSMNIYYYKFYLIGQYEIKGGFTMGLLRFLLNSPTRLRIRILQTSYEILRLRVEHLEKKLASTHFPDYESKQKLLDAINHPITVQTKEYIFHGKLIAVHSSSLEITDDIQQHIIIPFTKICSFHL